jgi:HD-GYP domain-containing protein (c-di-GMP phosphodiesterase class II)
MNCNEEELGELALGASLHDIGKIGIPDAILLKPGKLSPEETEIMRRHVNISHDLVSQHLFLSHAAQIVLTHHEFYERIHIESNPASPRPRNKNMALDRV